MAFEQKNNSGILFKNDKKNKPEQPDYNGSMKDANGNELEIAGWIKTGKKSGKKFISLTFKSKGQQSNNNDDPF
jgi:hypothetical protein